jgi:hypothetical protein
MRNRTRTYKNTLKRTFIRRVEALLKTQLNGKNIIKAINTHAIPLLLYSFGVIKWAQTYLANIQTKINTLLTKLHTYHPKSATERLTLPRKGGGRGLINITNLQNKHINNPRQYFHSKSEISQLHKTVTLVDAKYTPLNLRVNEIPPETNKIVLDADKLQKWSQKALHGRYIHELNQDYVDKTASHAWLTRSDMFSETEGFMCAIMDQVISTNNYKKIYSEG